MIREFAFGLSNRHYFQPSENVLKWQGMANDTFVSITSTGEYLAVVEGISATALTEVDFTPVDIV